MLKVVEINESYHPSWLTHVFLFEQNNGQFSFKSPEEITMKVSMGYTDRVVVIPASKFDPYFYGMYSIRKIQYEECGKYYDVQNPFLVHYDYGDLPQHPYYQLKQFYYDHCLIAQDMHSKEYSDWLNERAVYYNNGFYEANKKLGVEPTVKAVSNALSMMYHFSYSHSDKYSVEDGYGTVSLRNNVYYIVGHGCDECGSDWLNFKIDFKFDKDKFNKWVKTNNVKLTSCKEDEK